ncbi:MAG: mandelate racemase/muconate lactonizing enzyme family protein [Alphaproteobacteria bacterium]
MKITAVHAFWVHVPIPEGKRHTSDYGTLASFDATIVRIDTDAGFTGWGEGKSAVASAANNAGLTAIVNEEFAPLLVGEDPREPARIWEMLYSGTRAHYALSRGHGFPVLNRRGAHVAAIAAVDMALWDIKGKALDEPVWRLLGGRRAPRLPAYASGGWAPAESIGEQLQGYIDRGGFRSVKMRVGAMDGSPAASARRLAAARASLGPDIGIACDAHGTWTVAEAKRFAALAADSAPMWFEEPVSADDKRGMAEVRAVANMAISAGESEFTRHDFRELCELRAVDILQPDLAICGGITEAMRIAALASAYNLRLAPHLWGGAPAFAAGLAVAAASPAGFILEYSLGANPLLHELAIEGFPVEDGMIDVPDRPGLGITIDEGFVARYAVG